MHREHTSMCLFHASSLAVTVRVTGLYSNSGSSTKPRQRRNFFRALSLLLIKWFLCAKALWILIKALMARSQASCLNVLPSRRPSSTDSQRERKKVASYAGVQLKRGPRCFPGVWEEPLAPTALKSTDMADEWWGSLPLPGERRASCDADRGRAGCAWHYRRLGRWVF